MRLHYLGTRISFDRQRIVRIRPIQVEHRRRNATISSHGRLRCHQHRPGLPGDRPGKRFLQEKWSRHQLDTHPDEPSDASISRRKDSFHDRRSASRRSFALRRRCSLHHGRDQQLRSFPVRETGDRQRQGIIRQNLRGDEQGHADGFRRALDPQAKRPGCR